MNCPDCVEGFYWCEKHDIYVRTPERVAKLTPEEQAYDRHILARDFTCTCFQIAPCSFCCPNVPA